MSLEIESWIEGSIGVSASIVCHSKSISLISLDFAKVSVRKLDKK
jgi:hypothetical protein